MPFEGAEFIQRYLNCVVGFSWSLMQLRCLLHADVGTEARRSSGNDGLFQ
jgi:hypothetical protein